MKTLKYLPFFLLLLNISVFSQLTNIKVGSSTRNMIVYAPSGLSNPALIIQMHGMNQDAAYQKNASKWESIADQHKFVVVFPNGNNKSWDISGDNDINFLKTIIDSMYSKYKIDRNRVYVSGFSMGGMMSYHAANKMADKIAAIAPCSGYLFNNTAASSRAMPIIHIHGDADDVVGYGGVAGVMEAWRKHNGCPATPQVTKPYPANKANSLTTKTYWGPGRDNVAVVLLTNEGKGHWYSLDAAAGTNSSEEIWNFCKQYSLGQTSSIPFQGNNLRVTDVRFLVEKSILRIDFPGSHSNVNTLNIFDMKGQLVRKLTFGVDDSYKNVDLSGIAAGEYFLKLQSGSSRAYISQIMLTRQ